MTSETAKTCVTCIHLIGVRSNTQDVDRWKCGHINNKAGVNLVTGLQEYLSPIAPLRNYRADQGKYCSNEGLWWELYIHPSYLELKEKKPSNSLRGVGADDL